MAVKQTFEELKLTAQLPSPPGVGMRVLEITRREDYAAQDIAEAIMADSALTGRLLKIANSALHSTTQPVTTIVEATMRLGVTAVRNVALGLSLISSNRHGGCGQFDYERYWAKSLARALAAQAISRHCRRGSPSEAYVMGLLCEIGTLALASVYPDQYGNLLKDSGQAARSSLARHEREQFGIDHCEVGAFMIEDWGLPRANAEALLAFESDKADAVALDQGAAQLALTLRDAEIVAEVLLANEHGGQEGLQTLLRDLEDLAQRMGMGAAELTAFHERLSREFKEWLRLLKLPLREVAGLAALQSASQAIQPSRNVPVEPDLNAVQALHRAATVLHDAGSPRGIRILVVDDDPVSLRILEQALAQEGHQVITARDGREALQSALEHNPQAVIADWMMPRMDGVELCRTLRSIEQGREMYFLLLTSCDDEQRTVQAFEAGVDDYITKPISPRLLMARLKGSQRLIEIKAARERDRVHMSEQVKELAIAKRRLKATANTDVLTGLPNRRAILEAMEAEWSVSIGSGAPLSVIMIDVDHFKQVNDRHGHDVGDEVLREIARVLRASIRQGEDVARLGGEEFLVICPNTRHDQAVVGAERMRQAIERQLIHAGSFTGSVTASFGVAERRAAMQDCAQLLKRADEAVYQAKAAGRNAVCGDGGAQPAAKRA